MGACSLNLIEVSVQAQGDAVKNTSLLIDTLGFHSLMDDIFTRLLTLTSYISRRFIQFIGELLLCLINALFWRSLFLSSKHQCLHNVGCFVVH